MTEELFRENQLNLLQQAVNKLDELLVKLSALSESKNLGEKSKNDFDWIGQEELIKKMNITERTAAAWRSNGTLGASIVGRKIYYSKKSIEDMLWSKFKTRITI